MIVEKINRKFRTLVGISITREWFESNFDDKFEDLLTDPDIHLKKYSSIKQRLGKLTVKEILLLNVT